MVIRRWLSVSLAAGGVLVAIAAGLPPKSAAAQGVEQDCRLDDESRETVCFVTVRPTPTQVVSFDTGDPEERIPLQWVRSPGSARATDPATGTQVFACPLLDRDGDVLVGLPYRTQLINTDTGEVVRVTWECVYPGGTPPAPPPPPPTAAEFVEAVGEVFVVAAQINPNPAWGGITGLDTWLWCDEPGDVTVDATLRGWTAAAVMSPVQYHWQIDGASGPALINASVCGTEPIPGAVWMPETKGDHVIELAATWAGVWTLSYDGSPTGTFVLGPFSLDGDPVPYPVGEFDSRLVYEATP